MARGHGTTEFKLRIVAEFAKVRDAFRDLNAQTSTGIGLLAKWAGAFAIAHDVIKRIVGGLRDYAQAALEAMKIEQRLDAMSRLRGDTTGRLTGEIAKQASALQKLTGINDEVYKSGAAILLMSQRLTSDQIPKLMALAGDMAALLGEGEGGVAAAARLMMRAMEGGFEGLSRLGIRLTDEEKALQEQLRATGREIEANNLLIEKMQSVLGGVAAGQNVGVVGSLATIKISMADIKESLGRLMLREVTPLLDGTAKAVRTLADGMERIAAAHPDPEWLKLMQALPAIGPAIGALWTATGGLSIPPETEGGLVIPEWMRTRTTTRSAGMSPEDAARALEEFRARSEEVFAALAARNVEAEWLRFGREVGAGGGFQTGYGLREVRPGETPQWITDLRVKMAEGGRDGVGEMLEEWEDGMRRLAAGFQSMVINPISGYFADMIMGVETSFESLWKSIAASFLKAGISRALSQALSFIPVIGPFLGAFAGAFQQGGIVPGPIGEPRLAVVHGGETVLPTHGGPTGPIPVQVVTSDPTTMIRVGRQVYGRDNRYVSSLTTRDVARELY